MNEASRWMHLPAAVLHLRILGLEQLLAVYLYMIDSYLQLNLKSHSFGLIFCFTVLLDFEQNSVPE